MHTSRILVRGVFAILMCSPSLSYAASPAPTPNVSSGAMGNSSGLPANINNAPAPSGTPTTSMGNASGLPTTNPVNTNTVTPVPAVTGLPNGPVNVGTATPNNAVPIATTTANPGNVGGAAIGNASGLPASTGTSTPANNVPGTIAPAGTTTPPPDNTAGTGSQNNLSGTGSTP